MWPTVGNCCGRRTYYSVGRCDLLSEYRDLLSEYRDLLSEYRDLLSEYRDLLSEYRDLLSEYRDHPFLRSDRRRSCSVWSFSSTSCGIRHSDVSFRAHESADCVRPEANSVHILPLHILKDPF